LLTDGVKESMVTVIRPMGVFFYLHADVVPASPFVEIEHNALLYESEPVSSGAYHLLNIIVQSLFNVYFLIFD
jgi:hypothetical protein